MAIESLIEALRNGNRREASAAASELGATVVEPLIAVLRASSDVELRRAAAYVLGEIDDTRIVPALVDALERDQDFDVRQAALESLAQHPDSRAIESLIVVASGSDDALSEQAIRALGEIGTVVNSPRITQTLTNAMSKPDWGVRQSAAEMLILLGADQNSDAEKLLLADLQNEDAEIRLGAASSLAVLSDQRALDPLVRLLDHSDSQIVIGAAFSLGELGDPRALVPLSSALNHQDEAVQRMAQHALRRLDEYS